MRGVYLNNVFLAGYGDWDIENILDGYFLIVDIPFATGEFCL